MTYHSSAFATGPGALMLFVVILLVEELSQSPCTNDLYIDMITEKCRPDAKTPDCFLVYLGKTRTCCRQSTVGTCS